MLTAVRSFTQWHVVQTAAWLSSDGHVMLTAARYCYFRCRYRYGDCRYRYGVLALRQYLAYSLRWPKFLLT